MEDAGVKLRRAFGFGDASQFDPFLLLDDFPTTIPKTIGPAFPGIRIAASRPSLMCWPARSTTATAWATAARSAPATCSGINGGPRHSALGDAARRRQGPYAPLPASGQPAILAEVAAPRYQDVEGNMPEIVDDDGTKVRVITGVSWARRSGRGCRGRSAPHRRVRTAWPAQALKVETERHAFAYVFEGSGTFASSSQPFGVLVERRSMDARS